MQHSQIGHALAKRPVTLREMRTIAGVGGNFSSLAAKKDGAHGYDAIMKDLTPLLQVVTIPPFCQQCVPSSKNQSACASDLSRALTLMGISF